MKHRKVAALVPLIPCKEQTIPWEKGRLFPREAQLIVWALQLQVREEQVACHQNSEAVALQANPLLSLCSARIIILVIHAHFFFRYYLQL